MLIYQQTHKTRGNSPDHRRTILHSQNDRRCAPVVKLSRTPIGIYVAFDQCEDEEFKNEVKTGTENSYQRHFAGKLHFWVFFSQGY